MSNTIRILLAGLLGGVVMMVWMTVAHMASPLATVGYDNMPKDDATRSALAASMGDRPGLYGFPAMNMSSKDMGASMMAYEEKTRTGPSGFVVYHPAGKAQNMAASALTEFLKLWVVATIAAALLFRAAASLPAYLARVGFVGGIGLVAGLSTNVSYLAWYGFPGSYTAAAIFMDVVAYGLGGLVLAALIKPPRGLRA